MKRFSLILATLLVSGCANINVMSPGFSSGNQSSNIEGKFIDTAQPKLNLGENSASKNTKEDDWDTGLRYLRYGNKTVANLPDLRIYTNEILRRLHDGFSQDEMNTTVYITPGRDFEAYTLEHGVILISLGALLALDNEDQLAALLAHEYAHYLLFHHSKNTFEAFTLYGIRYTSIYLQSSTDSEENLQKRMSALAISRWVTDKALFTNWNRGQENDADILAVDMLVLAQYNADAMPSMLKKVEMSVAEKKAFITQNPVKVDEGPKEKKSYKLDVGILSANIVGTLEDKLDRDYESAKTRQKNVRDYMKKEYRDRPRPRMQRSPYQARIDSGESAKKIDQYLNAHQAEAALISGSSGLKEAQMYGSKALGGSIGEDPYTRMLMYFVRSSQKKDDKADINLERAYQTGQASMYTYELIVDKHLKEGKLQQANSLLEEMDLVFDKPVEILPDMITVKKQLGEAATPYLMRCVLTGDAELIKQCNLASKEEKVSIKFNSNAKRKIPYV